MNKSFFIVEGATNYRGGQFSFRQRVFSEDVTHAIAEAIIDLIWARTPGVPVWDVDLAFDIDGREVRADSVRSFLALADDDEIKGCWCVVDYSS